MARKLLAKRVLSDKVVAGLKPVAGEGWASRLRVPDDEVEGLSIFVYPSGTRSWLWERWAFDGTKKRSLKLALGDFPEMTTAAARDEARCLNIDVEKGLDPRIGAARREGERRHAEAVATSGGRTVRELFERFLRRPDVGATWRAEQSRQWKVEIAPRWSDLDAATITRKDAVALVQPIVDRGANVQANRVASTVRKFLAWCVEQGELDANPLAGARFKPGGKNEWKIRKHPSRALSDAEIKKVWGAFKKIGYPHGAALQWALYSGARRGEIANAKWEHIDFDKATWTIPITKQGTPHLVPLVPEAVKFLEVLKRKRADAYVFSYGNSNPLPTWGHATTEARRLSGVAFRGHDLRHTVRTRLSEVASPDVAERTIGHSLGGMREVYDHHDYSPQVRKALEAWTPKLLKLVGSANQ